LDHFFLSELLFQSVVAYECSDDGGNLSDHNALFLSLSVPVRVSEGVQKTSFQKKVSWCRASDAELSSYRSILGENLAKVAVPAHVLQCGVLCNTHRDEINAYHDEIVVACLNAAERAIPKCSKKGKAGWKELVDPSKKEAVFWHRIWVSNGRPRSGWISDIRNSTRREYKRISRWVVRNQEQLRADKMAASLASNNTRDLWREVKDVRRSGVPAPNLVDDTQGEEEVCSLFARKYSELYSSVGYLMKARCMIWKAVF
jgi:hypothetical protein